MLDGKCFTGAVETLRPLNGQVITLRLTTDGDDALRLATLGTNDDHCYLEELAEVGPNTFEVFLGS